MFSPVPLYLIQVIQCSEAGRPFPKLCPRYVIKDHSRGQHNEVCPDWHLTKLLNTVTEHRTCLNSAPLDYLNCKVG